MNEKIVNCPICESPMILRKSKVGNQFYGCSNYPSCKGIRQFVPEKIQRTEFQSKVFEPNKYQQVIFDEVQSGKNSLIVTACAGSGKTTTIERLASLLPKGKRVLYTVFNAKVRDEALRRMPINVTVLTTHQLGLQAITSYLKRKPVVDEDKVFKLTKDMIGQRWELDRHLISPVIKIVGLLKNTLSEPNSLEVQKIIDKFNIDIKDEDFERTIDLAIKAFHLSNKITDLIDYDDMLFFPYHHKMEGSKYDWVLTDECFPYKVPVLMENNINLPIGKIVEEKIEGRVLTYNVETGVQEYKKIINWHKIPNSKRLVKVLGVQFPNCNGGQRAAITCTDNHRIFTKEDGWVEAKDLIPGYHHIQSETSAKTSQSYKITGNGKKVLSETITENNKIKKTGNLDGKCFSSGFETNRGGNGKGLTEPQRIYLDRLGIGWFAEYVVIPTKEQRLEYKGATHYKIDIANPILKIAIELDRSLTIASRIYKKKDKILEELGWKVYHFENNFAVQNLENIVSEVYKNDCPVWCMVTSVNEAVVKEFYVYDITVEDNHNFYANSVLVHNCQDFNNAQIQLVLNSLNGNDSKSVGVGDENQCQPTGTKVIVADNIGGRYQKKLLYEKNIEDIKSGDLVLSMYRGEGSSFVKGQIVEDISHREYNGKLYTVHCDGKSTMATDNHKWLVKWNENIKDKYCVYLMQKGNWFRIGCHKLFSTDNGSSILQRLRCERADKVWILKVCENIQEGSIQEQILSLQFGIPQVIFYRKYETSLRNLDFIEQLYNGIPDILERGLNCLKHFNLSIDFPLGTKRNLRKQGLNCTFLVHSSNLMSDYMEIPSVNLDTINNLKIESQWKPIKVEVSDYRGMVYSLKVATTETYVADGLVTHNSIYGFRGASIDAMDKVKEGLKAEPYPLSITYRVPLSGVAYVNRRFPYIQFEGSPSKEDGVIDNIDNVTFTRNVKPGDMVLCRTNAPLVEPAFNLIRQGKKVTIVGRDIGNGLIEFIDRFKTGDINTLLEKMYNYRDKEQVKLAIAGKYMQLQILLDKIATIEALSDGCLTVQNITKKIGSVFSDTTQGVVFSTVHRAKGLEADNVYILYPDIIPHPMAQTSWEKRQEENLAYVAYTRHKKELHFIGEQNLLL